MQDVLPFFDSTISLLSSYLNYLKNQNIIYSDCWDKLISVTRAFKNGNASQEDLNSIYMECQSSLDIIELLSFFSKNLPQ